MFQIDTGSEGGSLGPWLSWSSNGSAERMIPPRTWLLRSKDEAGNTQVVAVPAFTAGCVMDLDTLKLGWEKDGAKGMAPERRWNPTVSQSTARPDESKKPNGKHCWSRALSVRLAIGGGQAATWEQGSFAAYEGFARLSKQIMDQWAAHSQNGALLPLVQQTAIEKKSLPGGDANIPVLTIVKWVPRPDCLKAAPPVIAAAAPVAAPAYVAPPVPQAAAVPDDMAF